MRSRCGVSLSRTNPVRRSYACAAASTMPRRALLDFDHAERQPAIAGPRDFAVAAAGDRSVGAPHLERCDARVRLQRHVQVTRIRVALRRRIAEPEHRQHAVVAQQRGRAVGMDVVDAERRRRPAMRRDGDRLGPAHGLSACSVSLPMSARMPRRRRHQLRKADGAIRNAVIA